MILTTAEAFGLLAMLGNLTNQVRGLQAQLAQQGERVSELEAELLQARSEA